VEDADAFFGDTLIENVTDREHILPKLDRDPVQEFYLGADIARLGSDRTVLIVIAVNKKTAEPVVWYWESIEKNTIDMAIIRIEQLHSVFDFRQMYVDETGCGSGVTDVLARKYNPNRITSNQLGDNYATNRGMLRRLKVIGVTFTNSSKFDILSTLKLLFEQSHLKIPYIPELVQELKDFRYEVSKYGNILLHHPTGGYDDWVDALALAAQGIRHAAIKPTPLITNMSPHDNAPRSNPYQRTWGELFRTYKKSQTLPFP
jgi:phage FluMu gp28-like protein